MVQVHYIQEELPTLQDIATMQRFKFPDGWRSVALEVFDRWCEFVQHGFSRKTVLRFNDFFLGGTDMNNRYMYIVHHELGLHVQYMYTTNLKETAFTYMYALPLLPTPGPCPCTFKFSLQAPKTHPANEDMCQGGADIP